MTSLESKVKFTRIDKNSIEEFKYVFRSVHEIEITKSVDELSDTAVIKLPTQFKIKENGKKTKKEKLTEKALQVGDKVEITLGYEGKGTNVEFVGYIKKINPKIPLEIHCEDAMWLLRRKNINHSWAVKVTLEEVLKEIIKDTDIVLNEPIIKFELEKWIIDNKNGAQALEQLKKEFGFTSFITDKGKLHCGLEQLTNINEIATYDLNFHLVENNLEYKTKEGQKIKVKYTYIDPKTNIPLIGEAGDPDGEQRSYTTSILADKVKLDELAKAELEKLQFVGYNGDITVFLLPYATRGMKAVLIDNDDLDKGGSYFINKVVTTFGMSGARRKVSIRNRL